MQLSLYDHNKQIAMESKRASTHIVLRTRAVFFWDSGSLDRFQHISLLYNI